MINLSQKVRNSQQYLFLYCDKLNTNFFLVSGEKNQKTTFDEVMGNIETQLLKGLQSGNRTAQQRAFTDLQVRLK